ncbi:MAG: tetratricopeptide repeat protein [Rickettsiales bacterium]|nr:tetratricopeptide repeat protein [Rickettsiales bacterium]
MAGFTYVDFYDFITSYSSRRKNLVEGTHADKKIDITSSTFATYLEPPEKYIFYLEYRGADKNIDIYQKPFLLDWFKISNSGDIYKDNSTAESILADSNFGLFFTSTMYSSRGRTYFLITQKAISGNMAKNLRVGDLIKVYALNLGYYTTDIPVFLVISYEKATTISQAIEDKMYFQQYFPVLRNDIFNRRYDKAKGNVELLLKKYPDNMELKLNLCLIYNQTNFFEKAISCYKEVLEKNPKSYNAYYGLAMTYYENGVSDVNLKNGMQNVIQNTTRAIGLINNLTQRPQGSMAMIYYNSLYLRAMAKVEIGDVTAIDDLEIVNENQPTLISSDSINIFKKVLGL